MKRLLLLRHAQAIPSAHDDHARALTPRGVSDSMRVGAMIEMRGWTPDRAVVSDARRTHQTFDRLGLPPAVSLDLLPELYNAEAETIIATLAAAPAVLACQLVVGHNPGIALAARALAGRGRTADLARLAGGFPTAALAVVRFDVTAWSAIGDRPGTIEAMVCVDDAAGA